MLKACKLFKLIRLVNEYTAIVLRLRCFFSALNFRKLLQRPSQSLNSGIRFTLTNIS